MAAATAAPVRHQAPRATRAFPVNGARLLWVELRRNSMPWMLPLIAALFWFDSYRPSTGTEALYPVRTFWNMGQGHTIIDFGPFVAGVAAWVASRDGRRGLTDLVTATARSRWAAQLASWAATAIWAVAAYLLFVGVMFAMYAYQRVGGTPPWWWVADGATAVAGFSAAGFAVGAYWRSRFAAPAAAFGGFLAMMLSSQTGFHWASGWALILPTNSNGNFDGNYTDAGTYYRWLPDLPIARIIFLAGILIAVLGTIGLAPRAGGRWARRSAALITLAGMAAAGSGVWLATTARLTAHGMAIPDLHNAANDRPIAYTPSCGRISGIPVCLNPAFRRWLPDVTTALAPVLGEVAGLPGAPGRVTQVPAAYPSGGSGPPQAVTLGGNPTAVRLQLGQLNLPGPCGFCSGPLAVKPFVRQIRLLFAHAFVGAGGGPGSPAQQAVQAALLQDGGLPFAEQPKALSLFGQGPWAQQELLTLTGGPGSATAPSASGPGSAGGPVYIAARRFADLPSATRHAWLAAHLSALRAGQLTLKDLP